jgi:hypothetical protein
MSGARPSEVFQSLELVVLVDNFQGDRAAERGIVPDAALDLDPIGFDPLTAAAPIASLPTAELDVD